MANVNARMGLRPINAPNGNTPKVGEYVHPASGAAIYEGAPVYRGETGVVALVSTITTFIAHSIVGVAAAHSASTSAAKNVLVYDDPDQLYLLQADDNSIITEANKQLYIGRFFALTIGTGTSIGNTTTGQSRVQLDASSGTTVLPANTTSLLVQLVGFWDAPSNTLGSTYNKWIVKINPFCHIWGNSYPDSQVT